MEKTKKTAVEWLVVKLLSEHVMGDDCADEIRDELLSLATVTDATTVILDFQKVTFLSHTGFRPLLSLHRLLRQKDGKLLLCSLSPEIHEIFETTRLISTRVQARAPFQVFPDVPSAVASLYALQSAS